MGSTPLAWSGTLAAVTSPPRFWPWVVLLGLVGQIAWAVENMYLNVYVYDTITDPPAVLSLIHI